MGYKYFFDQKKYRIKPEQDYLRFNGWCFETRGRDYQFVLEINGNRTEFSIKRFKRKDVQQKYKKYPIPVESGFQIKIPVNKGAIPDKLELYLESGEDRKEILSLDKKEIEQIKDDSSITYGIDRIWHVDSKMYISGWANSIFGCEAIQVGVVSLSDNSENKLKITRTKRLDVVDSGLIEKQDVNCGFIIEFPFNIKEKYVLQIEDGKRKKNIKLFPKQIIRHNAVESKVGFARQFVKRLNPDTIKSGVKHLREYGFKDFKEYLISRVNDTGKSYKEWFKENQVTQEELNEQRKRTFSYSPVISVIVPTYKTPIIFLREMIDSVLNQSYPNWELCIADGSEGDKEVERELGIYAQKDKRIRYCLLDKNEGISGNTNAALKMATGDYVGLFDHDDLLAPNALYEIVNALQEKEYDILYTDEDKITGDGKEHMDPNFKPDFSMDLFCSHNYITHFFVVKTEIIKGVGGFRKEFDGSQDYDIMFRCIEQAESIKHIPMILYHWRIHMNSVAGDPASKMYAYDAGKHAIEEHFKRVGISAKVEHAGLWGMYHILYETPGDPLISIIIPNKDHIDDLSRCIESIVEKSVYSNYEIVIVENNSEEAKTFQYYDKIEQTYSNIKVVKWDGPFNYSAINNFGVKYTNGEYLLFLNNDTELITPTALKEMLGCCMREDVGAVGAKLLYADDTVQHAGVVIGFGGYAGHVNTGIERDDYGYMVRARINCNYSAVTAACMMTKKSLFHQVQGFDEQFVVACNDVDYCLKLRKLGKWIVYNAFSEWYHYESKSRGYEDTPEKLKRFEGEIEKFQKKWPEILEKGDPFYNPNFSINQAPFTLT